MNPPRVFISYSNDEDQWKLFEGNFIAPEGADSFLFDVRVYKGSAGGGFVYYDDFFFGVFDNLF